MPLRRIIALVAVAAALSVAATAAPAQAATPLARCIIRVESRGDTQARNGIHLGIAQWSPEAWARHGGRRYARTPLGASYSEQLAILESALRRFGCRDWCPFDPC